MDKEARFEKVRADDGIHYDIAVNWVEAPANVCALASIAASLALTAVGLALLFAGVFG